jgi:diguanylate cyclase (GGDEF)-like protein
LLALLLAEVLRPQVTPEWRFWDVSDGMAESYSTGVVGSSHGVWLKPGHTAMGLLDAYQFIMSTHPHAVGHFRGTRDGVLWLWNGAGLQRFSSGSWATFPLTEVASLGMPQLNSEQVWQFTSRQDSRLVSEPDLGPISRDRVLILLPDRIQTTGLHKFEVRTMDRTANVDPSPPVAEFLAPPPWYGNTIVQLVAGFSLVCIVCLLAVAILSYRQRGRLIAELHRKKRLETDRQSILEMVARRKPLSSIYQRIARSIAVNCPGTLAGVMRIKDGRWKTAGDSALPQPFVRYLETINLRQSGFDERWTSLHAAASRHGLSGCHFAPIRSGGDELLGAIAAFLRQGAGGPFDVPTISAMSNLAGVAIDSARLYERLAYQARHDALTGLPNRLTFESTLLDAFIQARQCSSPLAVFFLDLDRFKQINDSLGHRVGDMFLKQVACRLSSATPTGATLARIGGDEFTLVLPYDADAPRVEQTAECMLESLHAPCEVEGHDLFASASIGISLYPRDADDPATLQRHADSAMYRAKLGGKNRWEYFTAEMAASSEAALQMEPILRSAIEQQRLELYYQPQFSMLGRLTGLEALLRLRHPVLGLITPEYFLSQAEETGLMIPIGEWAVRRACSQIRDWRQSGHRMSKVSVNISSVQLGDRSSRTAFSDSVGRVLEETGIEPGLLELELAETAILGSLLEPADHLQRLKSLGVRIAVDHFGAGYSSLTYLQRLPVNFLNAIKIDRSFINGLDARVSTLPLVQAIVAVSRNLGLEVVAMGIERARQLKLLHGIHTGSVQGYYCGRPQPAAQIERLLQSGEAHWLDVNVPAG